MAEQRHISSTRAGEVRHDEPSRRENEKALREKREALIERARREVPALRETVATNLADLRRIARG